MKRRATVRAPSDFGSGQSPDVHDHREDPCDLLGVPTNISHLTLFFIAYYARVTQHTWPSKCRSFACVLALLYSKKGYVLVDQN